MLKFTRSFMGLLGIVLFAVAVTCMVFMFYRYNSVWSMATANHGTPIRNPRLFMWLTPAAALVSGLLLGMAIAMPRRSARSIRNETRDLLEAEREQGLIEQPAPRTHR